MSDTGQLRPPPNLGVLLATSARRRGHSPLLTFYGLSGERTELSYATFENWAAKTANLLVEEVGLTRGARLGLTVTGHWIGAVVMVAAWKVGVAVVVGPQALGSDVAVIPEGQIGVGGLPARLIVVGGGMGGRVAGDVPGVAYGDQVLLFGDDFDDPDVTLADPALQDEGQTLSQAELLARSQGLLGPADRLVSSRDLASAEAVATGLAAVLAAGASWVWCPGADAATVERHAAAERATPPLRQER